MYVLFIMLCNSSLVLIQVELESINLVYQITLAGIFIKIVLTDFKRKSMFSTDLLLRCLNSSLSSIFFFS